jgi:PAS domain-containing protein
MSDEEIYQRIRELERQIAELRRKLSAANVTDWKVPKEDAQDQQAEPGDPFIVQFREEMELNSLPELVSQILDALPVQVYIKKAELDPAKKARKYIYLNQMARSLRGWSREDVREQYDRNVFAPDDQAEDLYINMRAQETQTIKSKKSRITYTPWTVGDGCWSRNRNIEIPILDQIGNGIGFCSIAHDLVFRELPTVLSFYQRSSSHSIKNLIGGARGVLDSAKEKITDSLKRISTPHPDLSAALNALNAIGYLLELAWQTSQLQNNALGSIGGPIRIGTIGAIIDDLRDTYKDCGITLTIATTVGADMGTKIQQPNAVKAILSAFIANAVKYRPRDSSIKDFECTIACKVNTTQVDWEVCNACEKYTHAYSLADAHKNDGRGQGFDFELLRGLVTYAFPKKKPEDIIFTEKPTEFTFKATLITEVVHDA